MSKQEKLERLERAEELLRQASGLVFDAGINISARGEFDPTCYRIRIAVGTCREDRQVLFHLH